MIHPAKRINQINLQIANEEYDEAIVSLVGVLRTIKLVLSGDARISIESERVEIDRDNDQRDDTTPSSGTSLEYDFFSTPKSPSILETADVGNECCHSSYYQPNPQRTRSDLALASHNKSDESTTYCSAQKHHPQIFRDPMMVRGNFFRASLDNKVCQQLSYVALYNLALSHHLKSMQLSRKKSEKQTEYLQKALSLYEHFHEALMAQTASNSIPITHGMALLGNLGHIHRELGNQRSSETCLQCLLSRTMYLVVTGQVDKMGDLMDTTFDIVFPCLSIGSPAPAA